MARRNDQGWERWDSNSGFLFGALAGALVGAGVALLLAPKSGAQVRSDISSGFTTARDAAARRYRDLADKAGEKLGYDGTSTTAVNGGTGADRGDSFTATPGTGGY
jgi:gas vesicle protein